MKEKEKKSKGSGLVSRLIARVKENRRAFRVFVILRAFIIFVLVRSILMGNYENAFTCVLSLLLLLIPAFVEEKFNIEVPQLFQIIIYCFIVATEILGEVNHYYVNVKGWDTIMHTISGFLFAAVGFSTIDLLNRKVKKITLSPFYLTMVAFCFSMTIGVLWEFFECAMDIFFLHDMQKDQIVQQFASSLLGSDKPLQVLDIEKTVIYTAGGEVTIDGGYLDIGILDTMKDLFVNLVGAVTFSIIGYLYEKNHSPKSIAPKLMLKPADDEDAPHDDGTAGPSSLGGSAQVSEKGKLEETI
ncbi:MAG: hypothetical protein ACOX6J_00225 [Oscillospiraceae bacterium]|jgi:hypothetical protein